jgi:hypothetical protein
MTLFVPVQSPVASCEATGASAWSARRIASTCQRLRGFQRGICAFRARPASHNFSPPRAQHRRPAVLLLPVLVPLSACVPAAHSEFLVIKFPANIALLLVIILGCGLAGFGLGLVVALQLLRASDRAAAQYHRAQIARVLGASSSVHASVQEVLSIVHRRTQELQRLVAMLQKEGAK